MKLKVTPEDFIVRERLALKLKPAGAYSVYRLEKRHWNTLDCIDHLARRHGLRPLARAGLKDRHALTTQYLSLPGSGPRLVREANYCLRLVGKADEPVSPALLIGNDFIITVRSLTTTELESFQTNLRLVRQYGLPNYFDEQRFGSARHAEGFIARRLADGHLNGALKLYLATPAATDPPAVRRNKQALAAHWGDWQACARLATNEAKPALDQLARNRNDFAGAIRRLPRALLDLFLNAWQSWLWNETVVELIRSLGVKSSTLDYSQGQLVFWHQLTPEQMKFLSRAVLPTAAPGISFASERVGRAAAAVFERENIKPERLRLPVRIPGVYFKSFERQILLRPTRLHLSAPADDERYPGRSKLRLSFQLPPGSYATIVVKRLSLNTR